MTDAEALARIETVLDGWFRAELTELQAIAKIALITGEREGSK